MNRVIFEVKIYPMADLHILVQTVSTLCYEVGKFMKAEQFRLTAEDVETKDLNSFVSYVDKEAEKMLVKGLKEILPESGFIAEEGTETYRSETYNWIVDPLDGTTNYLHGLPVFAISIALQEGDELVLGVVYELGNDEMFTAWKGGGTHLNNKPVRVAANNALSRSLLATGFPYYDYQRLDNYLELLADCFRKTRGVRRFGSAATDLAYVACGRFDGFFEYGLSPWDVAAGAVLVQEAGGQVSDFRGGSSYVFGKEILAGSAALFPDLKALVKNHMS